MTWRIKCTDCGHKYSHAVSEMKRLPSDCISCGGKSFEIVEDEEEELTDEEREAREPGPNMRIDALERMEEDKRDSRL